MEDTLAELALAAVFFLATHVSMSSTPIRAALVGVLSEKGFFAIYSLVTFATMGWMIVAYGRAPDLVLWRWVRRCAGLPLSSAWSRACCSPPGLARTTRRLGPWFRKRQPPPARLVFSRSPAIP